MAYIIVVQWSWFGCSWNWHSRDEITWTLERAFWRTSGVRDWSLTYRLDVERWWEIPATVDTGLFLVRWLSEYRSFFLAGPTAQCAGLEPPTRRRPRRPVVAFCGPAVGNKSLFPYCDCERKVERIKTWNKRTTTAAGVEAATKKKKGNICYPFVVTLTPTNFLSFVSPLSLPLIRFHSHCFCPSRLVSYNSISCAFRVALKRNGNSNADMHFLILHKQDLHCVFYGN